LLEILVELVAVAPLKEFFGLAALLSAAAFGRELEGARDCWWDTWSVLADMVGFGFGFGWVCSKLGESCIAIADCYCKRRFGFW
jgi:hypothetical protein